MKIEQYKRRTFIILLLFSLWTAALAVLLFYHGVVRRDTLLQEGIRLAWRTGKIPAGRGRILDRNGRALAWTERYFDLVVDKGELVGRHRDAAKVMASLSEKFPSLSRVEGAENLYRAKGLSPSEMDSLGDYISRYSGIRISPRLERKYVDYENVRRQLGKTASIDGVLSGIDGIEKERDAELRGEDGIYMVMLDRYGRIIKGSSKVKKEMLPGKDVVLDKSIEEMK